MSSKQSDPFGHATRRNAGSIGARLSLLFMVASGLLLLIATVFLYFGAVRTLRHQDERLLASKIRVVRTLLKDPAHAKGLESEIEHEAGEEQALKYFIRVLDPRSGVVLATPEMDALLPTGIFPPLATAGSLGVAIRPHRQLRREYLLLTGDAQAAGDRPGTRLIQIALDTTPNREILAEYRRWLLFALGAGTIFSGLAGMLVARDGLRPLREITQAAREVRASSLEARLQPETWPEELQELATAFDAMLDRLQGSFARLTEFSGDIAHALRNPVNNLRGEAEVALTQARTPDEYRQTMASMLEELDRLSKLVENLLFVARADHPESAIKRASFPVAAEMNAVREFYEALAADRQIAVTCEGEATVEGDPTLVRRAVSNLLGNALKHTAPGGAVWLTAVTRPDCAVEIAVRDNGRGIPGESLPRLFDRFYQVRPTAGSPARGVGLGLAIVKSIMRLHGGEVQVTSTIGVGTTFVLRFPPPGNRTKL
jgi:two-component system heavy metal sensor histidine kinase CusS